MVRFGLHMSLRGGREALVRLLVTAAAVGIGVGLLLSVLGTYHAYQTAVAKPCWECTNQSVATGTLLWNYNEDVYDGKTIERLDVATLSADAPTIPGLAHMPAAGQYAASPALAALLATVPADELRDRFPGTLAGTIGAAGLQSPDELAIVIGRPAAELASLPNTQRVSHIQTAPRGLSTSQFYQFGFALGTVALLLPLLVLIGNATRMAAGRREERYAAMRLVGATRLQISIVASIDAVVGALIGALLGLGIYALVRPLLSDIQLLGYRFFTDEITPTPWGYVGALIAVPLAAALACLASLRRVGISPLGVIRRVTPPAPRFWRALPLLAGLGVFCIPLLADPAKQRHSPGLAVLSLIVVMLGLMIAGPWLTMVAARGLARWARGGSGLLAARRLADNPRAAFRAVSGLVLAVMVGTALAAIVPAAVASENTSQDSALADVLRVGLDNGNRAKQGPNDFQAGLTPAAAAPVLAKISAIPGTKVVPLYHPSQADDALPQIGPFRGGESVIRCSDIAALPVLGTCPSGASTVMVDTSSMYTDNLAALNDALPFVTARNPATTDDVGQLLVSDLMVSTDSAATLERVRTVLSTYGTDIDPDESPMTFGEVSAERAKLYLEIQRMVTIIAGVTLLVAGCGLAIAVSGGVVERKRPFTLLRVTGTDTGALHRAVLLETVFPLVAATVVAAGVGLALAYPITRALAPARHALVLPHAAYYLTLGTGLLISAVIVTACLPILGRITATENARFE
jgi:hypothetical protein